MPIDAQLREQFEKWIDEKQYGLGWQDGRGTWEEFLSATWAGYQAGSLSRDAEVQALRKALQRLIAAIATERDVWTEADADHLNEVLADARAALAGGETGETE